MSDLAEFLLACIDEDEAAAYFKGAHAHACSAYHGRIDDPFRWLAECEAKREIIKLHRPAASLGGWISPPFGYCPICSEGYTERDGEVATMPFPCPTIRALAAVYAGHPGFRQEWTA